ncbi:MAG: hypothetical protein NZM04_10380 [Methylacidiphilales bacterium]|nr:hypothetical protein [Candidatus Methylacidiphilales bacterium]
MKINKSFMFFIVSILIWMMHVIDDYSRFHRNNNSFEALKNDLNNFIYIFLLSVVISIIALIFMFIKRGKLTLIDKLFCISPFVFIIIFVLADIYGWLYSLTKKDGTIDTIINFFNK